MLAVLAPIFVFGLVVFVHELGHFLAAKAVGVYAPRFSIGFGPPLWRRRRGETEYVIAALPLGGYVRMASRLDAETASLEGGGEESGALKPGQPGYDPEAMIPFGPKPVPEHRWFESKPLWARLLIMIAGVTMNIVLALVVAIGLAYAYGRPVVDTTVVGAVRPVPGAEALAALQPGDTIRSVNGIAVADWNTVRDELARSAGTVSIVTNRGTVTVPVGRDGEKVAEAIDFHVPPVIDSIVAGAAAARAGLQSGDSVVSIAGEPVRSWGDLVRRVSASPGRALPFVVRRAGSERTLTVIPDSSKGQAGGSGKEETVGRIGVGAPQIVRTEPVGLGQAVASGWNTTWEMAGGIVRVVKRLATREVSMRQLGGPIAITEASVQAARVGFDQLLYLIALLSVNVAVLNLLPIPILDGGQIVLNVLESAKGSPFSLRTREHILRVGLAAIIALFIVVMYNDITRLVSRLFS